MSQPDSDQIILLPASGAPRPEAWVMLPIYGVVGENGVVTLNRPLPGPCEPRE